MTEEERVVPSGLVTGEAGASYDRRTQSFPQTDETRLELPEFRTDVSHSGAPAPCIFEDSIDCCLPGQAPFERIALHRIRSVVSFPQVVNYYGR